ncbi:MAG: GIY-YIG nuclease family protein, partial [Acidobacteriota bacterium]
DITALRHVRSRAEINAAEEIANREKCEDFNRFQPLFKQAESELASGARQTRPFGKDASVETGDFFILGGQVVYVAEKGDVFRPPNGKPDARLRVIYSNGTESNILLRSLQRALYKDDAGRRLTDPNAGPLFSETCEKEDIESGTIYVLRSKSEHPIVAANREILHKIGVTGGDVAQRIANAELESTYLLAGVDVVATYQLFNINRTKLENIIHRVFAPARLDIEIKDRFGNPVTPREWFLVPIFVVDAVVERIKDGTITQYVYDPKTASLVKVSSPRAKGGGYAP